MRRCPKVVSTHAITGLGDTWPETWKALLTGRRRLTSTREIGGYDVVDVPVCAIPNLDRSIDSDGRGPAYRLLRRILTHADTGERQVASVYGGSNHGEADLLQCLQQQMTAGQARSLLQDSLPLAGVQGSRWTYAACSSGLHALASAVLDVEEGCDGDVVVAAVDTLSLLEIIGFRRVGALTSGTRFPFHPGRDGLLIGEAAVAVRLADPHSDGTGVRLMGFGLSCDAGHPTDPDPSGSQLERAIRHALRMAGLSPSDVAAVVAHGTGTEKNDAVEAAVFQRIWPSADMPVTSIKASLGHTMGAAGLLNLLVAAEACRTNVLPPIVPEDGDTLPGAHFIVGAPHPIAPAGAIVAIASGFGGNNAAFVVSAGV